MSMLFFSSSLSAWRFSNMLAYWIQKFGAQCNPKLNCSRFKWGKLITFMHSGLGTCNFSKHLYMDCLLWPNQHPFHSICNMCPLLIKSLEQIHSGVDSMRMRRFQELNRSIFEGRRFAYSPLALPLGIAAFALFMLCVLFVLCYIRRNRMSGHGTKVNQSDFFIRSPPAVAKI